MNIPLRSRVQRNPTALPSTAWRSLALVATAAGFGAQAAHAQVRFSIDHRGPTIAGPNTCDAVPVTAGDILTPSTGAPCTPSLPALGAPVPPSVVTHGGVAFGGLGIATWGGCVGAPPGAPCPIEVDALSYAMDASPAAGAATPPGTYVFSTDEFAIGMPGSPLPPAVWTEGPVGDQAADVWASLAMPPAPLPPGGPAGHTGLVDGNGFVSGSGAVYPGLGLFEPRFPAPIAGPALGDNLDAVDFDTPATTVFLPVYFSLDPAWPNPMTGVPHLATGPINGFPPAAILVTPAPGGPPVVYAAPALLGLDLFGFGSDDLDALALRENGTPGYQPGGDYVRFSVRLGSAIVGIPDSLFGLPIEPGDILMPPPAAGMPPAIWIAAEAIGLATARSGMAPFGDELDALDIRNPQQPPPPVVPFCFGDGTGATPCPCANFGAPGEGCRNSTGTGAKLTAAGTPVPDTLVLTSSGEPATASSIFLQGSAPIAGVVFGDGVRCVGGVLKRLYTKFAVAGVVSAPTGADPSITARSAVLGDPIAPGSTRWYQVYYRDPSATFCPPETFNVTNGLAVTW